MIVLIGVALIVAGCLAMMGGATTDPSVYPEDELYGFRRTVLAPILILAGLVTQVFAIIKKPAQQDNESEE